MQTSDSTSLRHLVRYGSCPPYIQHKPESQVSPSSCDSFWHHVYCGRHMVGEKLSSNFRKVGQSQWFPTSSALYISIESCNTTVESNTLVATRLQCGQVLSVHHPHFERAFLTCLSPSWLRTTGVVCAHMHMKFAQRLSLPDHRSVIWGYFSIIGESGALALRTGLFAGVRLTLHVRTTLREDRLLIIVKCWQERYAS